MYKKIWTKKECENMLYMIASLLCNISNILENNREWKLNYKDNNEENFT
jgi:hypothetical protein